MEDTINIHEYLGNTSQLYCIEEHRLVGGKGDGIRLIEVNNGKGLMFTISADRCGDISRLFYKGVNIGFFSPCGYVSPSFYDNRGTGFLKSFTAGFFTTCGLTAVGSPCIDDGEELPLHGTISNIPAENVSWSDEGVLKIKLIIRDATLFLYKLLLTREYECSLKENQIIIHDCVENIGAEDCPYMILYHFNLGYPLLTENTQLNIPFSRILPRNERAAEGIDNAMNMEKPQKGFEEQCYYYDVTDGIIKIYNPDLGFSMTMMYDKNELPYFTQWKMMGSGEYVLGLEPGNCTPDGRDVMRKNGTLRYLKPSEKVHQTIKIIFSEE